MLTLIFDKFSGAKPQTPIQGKGYGAPLQTPPPWGHLDSQVRRAPQYLNPVLRLWLISFVSASNLRRRSVDGHQIFAVSDPNL